MDENLFAAYRQQLAQKRDNLVGQVWTAEKYSRERDLEATQDPADMAASIHNKEILVSMSANDRALLSLVEEALQRMDKGGYGVCVHCKEPIQAKRLAAIPWARLCLRCQERAERGTLDGDDE